MLLRPTPISARQLTWVPAERLYVTEASSLPPLGRVYDDACDVGLTVTSQYSSREIVFVVEHEERFDGDLLYQDLRPAPGQPNLGFYIRIYND